MPASSAGARRRCGHLRHADVVAERVTKPEVDAIRLLGRLLREFDAALGLELVVGLAGVRRREEEMAAGASLGQERTDFVSRGRIHRRWAGFLQHDLALGVARDVDREKA